MSLFVREWISLFLIFLIRLFKKRVSQENAQHCPLLRILHICNIELLSFMGRCFNFNNLNRVY